MANTKITIIFLVTTILSLMYVVLDYYGYIRFIKLHLCTPDSFIENYKNLEVADGENKVVVSLTTTPEKLGKLKPVINSLLDQTVKVNLITITVPYGKEYSLPKEIKNAVMLYRTGINYKNANSLIPSLIREGENNTKIITLGDDMIYGKDFIETMLNESSKYPDNVIYTGSNSPIKITKGALFKPIFFSESFINMPENYDSDKWVNKHVNKKHFIKYNDNIKI